MFLTVRKEEMLVLSRAEIKTVRVEQHFTIKAMIKPVSYPLSN